MLVAAAARHAGKLARAVRTGGRWKSQHGRHLASGPPVCKLRGKNLPDKPGRTRRYHLSPQAARIIAALLALRNHVIAPILAGIRSPRRGRRPAHWTRIDRDYETPRTGMQALFHDVGIQALPAAHRQHFADGRSASSQGIS